jgi:tRNA(fMet)-specific endonuclease VapC
LRTGINEIALDTSVVIQVFRDDVSLKEHFARTETIWLPVPVIGEVMIGFLGSDSFSVTRREFEEFLANSKIIDCTNEVAMKYAEVNVALRKKGNMIPKNDIWIAACCIVHKKRLATKDSHFLNVHGLSVEMW